MIFFLSFYFKANITFGIFLPKEVFINFIIFIIFNISHYTKNTNSTKHKKVQIYNLFTQKSINLRHPLFHQINLEQIPTETLNSINVYKTMDECLASIYGKVIHNLSKTKVFPGLILVLLDTAIYVVIVINMFGFCFFCFW